MTEIETKTIETQEEMTKPSGSRSAPQKIIFRRRQKVCPFSTKNALEIDYKDVKLLQRFISDRGRMSPRRITGVSAHAQRKLSKAIKRARHLALLPYEVR